MNGLSLFTTSLHNICFVNDCYVWNITKLIIMRNRFEDSTTTNTFVSTFKLDNTCANSFVFGTSNFIASTTSLLSILFVIILI